MKESEEDFYGDQGKPKLHIDLQGIEGLNDAASMGSASPMSPS